MLQIFLQIVKGHTLTVLYMANKFQFQFFVNSTIEMSVSNLLFHGSGDNLQMNFLGATFLQGITVNPRLQCHYAY